MTCTICGRGDVSEGPIVERPAVSRVDCACCGKYKITLHAKEAMLDCLKDQLHMLSAVLRHDYENGRETLVHEQVTSRRAFNEQVVPLVPTDIRSKLDALLRCLARKSKHPGMPIHFMPCCDYPLAYCKNEEECLYYIRHLCADGMLTADRAIERRDLEGGSLCITVSGWERAEAMNQPNRRIKQAFVAMSFTHDLLPIFDQGIKPLEAETGYIMRRIDLKEFNDDVVAEIFAEIRRSQFVIADVTGQRNGVYFEAGYAMGLGIPVIWTCRKDDMNNAHFDTNHFSHVTWQYADELRNRLKNRILGTIVVR